MAWIELFEDRASLGEHDLPLSLESKAGNSVRLGYAIRKGGNGVVFQGRLSRPSVASTQDCAVKFLRQLDKTRIDRFQNEVRIMSSLAHVRVASLFDAGEITCSTGHVVPWAAMERGGRNLREHVRNFGPIPFGMLTRIGVQMCEALQHIHERAIIHRDIKPDNFVWEGDAQRDVKMIDFGIAKYIGEDVSARPLDEFTQHMEFVGPVFFSSPELIAYASDKSHPVTCASDLFQLGKVLWFLGTGSISAGVPAKKSCPANGKLRELVLSLVDDDPDSRPSSASEVARKLQAI